MKRRHFIFSAAAALAAPLVLLKEPEEEEYCFRMDTMDDHFTVSWDGALSIAYNNKPLTLREGPDESGWCTFRSHPARLPLAEVRLRRPEPNTLQIDWFFVRS